MEQNVWVTASGVTSFGSDRYHCFALEGTVVKVGVPSNKDIFPNIGFFM
jgi:hypothetical protein